MDLTILTPTISTPPSQDAQVEQTTDDLLSLLATGPIRSHILHPVPFVQELVARLRPAAEAKGLNLRVEPCMDRHDVVNDAVRVGYLLAGLIADAIDHSDAGLLRLIITPPDGEHWHVWIINSGSDMSAGEAIRPSHDCLIGSPLPSTNNKMQIATCKYLAERLRGKLSWQTTSNRGISCKVTLPVMMRDS